MTTTPTAVPAPATAPVPPRTWRGLAIRSRQKVAANIAAAALFVSTMYLVLASVWAMASQSSWTAIAPPSEGQLAMFTWQYRLVEGPAMTIIEWGYPPVLVVILLFVAMSLVGISQGMANPIRRAKGKVVSTRFASPRERGRMHGELRAAGYGGLANAAAKVRLIVGGVLSAAAALLVLIVPVEDGFTRGYGPAVALAGAGLAVIAVLVAAPWGHWPQVVLLEDGTMLVDGVEPLAAGRAGPAAAVPPPAAPVASVAPAPPAPPAPAASAMPPGWYPDPTGNHERRYWDGTTWTASVGDTEAPSDPSHPLVI